MGGLLVDAENGAQEAKAVVPEPLGLKKQFQTGGPSRSYLFETSPLLGKEQIPGDSLVIFLERFQITN